jgi:hypothetical protein
VLVYKRFAMASGDFARHNGDAIRRSVAPGKFVIQAFGFDSDFGLRHSGFLFVFL